MAELSVRPSFHCDKLHCWLDEKWCKVRAEKLDYLGGLLYPTCHACKYGLHGEMPIRKTHGNIRRRMATENKLRSWANREKYRSVEAMLLDFNNRMTIREMSKKIGVSYYAIQIRLRKLHD